MDARVQGVAGPTTVATGFCNRCTRWKTGLDGGLCWACRSPSRARRRAALRRNEIRRPPPLPFRGKRGLVVVDGLIVERLCSLCGGPVPRGRFTWCGQECIDVWNTAALPTFARAQLVELHGDLCWGCWDETNCEVDHVRPLWSLDDDERLQLRWWLPSNLQLLGHKCHTAKTSREATFRAVYRRAQAEGRRVRYAG